MLSGIHPTSLANEMHAFSFTYKFYVKQKVELWRRITWLVRRQRNLDVMQRRQRESERRRISLEGSVEVYLRKNGMHVYLPNLTILAKAIAL